ncbi:Solitary outer membrane autotransporter beta-barrel domain [Vibrio rarus]|uniref:Solitary outer membrane autotransporter beta-barrel domain n=1 Tax=Vibrio rarus TaxID=413403 RepID=UPI0021C28BC8|nr:Solitary outer membrane autotransporter beta-barrel domain [Vibrio rarus]
MKYGYFSVFAVGMLTLPNIAFSSLIDTDKYLSDIYSTALVLTDSELVSFGFGNFDPNQVFGTNNPDFGGKDAIDTRRRIAVTSLPISFQFSNDNSAWLQRLKLRAAYMELRRDINYDLITSPDGTQWQTDENKDQVLAGYAEYSVGYQVSEGWQFFVGSGLHLMHYSNQFTANSPAKDYLDQQGIASVINGSSNTWMIEPQLDFIYTKDIGPGELKFNSEYHYFWGRSFSGSIDTSGATPSGWRVMNGLQYKYHLKPWGSRKQDVLFRARRVDVGGDLRDPLDTTHYGEYSIGWLLDTSDYSALFYNVGIGVSINYGSSLKGGALVLFYNE